MTCQPVIPVRPQTAIMLSFHREWWETSFSFARIFKRLRYCLISKQSNCSFSEKGITQFRNIQHLLFLPGFQSVGVAPSQSLPLGGTRKFPVKAQTARLAEWEVGNPTFFLLWTGKTRVWKYWGVLMPGGLLWHVGQLGSEVTEGQLAWTSQPGSGMGMVPASLRGHTASRRSGREPISKAGDDTTRCQTSTYIFTCSWPVHMG